MRIIYKLFTLIAFSALFIGFVSCNKDNEATFSSNNPNKSMPSNTEIVNGFTYADVLYLTSLHNEFCEEYANIFDLSRGTVEEEMERCITEAILDGLGETERKNIIDSFRQHEFIPFSTEDLALWILENKDIKDKRTVSDFVFSISEGDLDSSTYVSFSRMVDSLQTDACRILSGYDLLAVITYMEQAKASYYYWMPEEAGGSGLGYSHIVSNFTPKTKGNNAQQPSKWWKAAASASLSDAKAATVASYVVAFSGGTGLGAAAAGVAGSSLLDGVITLLSEWNN